MDAPTPTPPGPPRPPDPPPPTPLGPPPTDGLRARATRGVASNAAAQLVKLAVQVGSVVVLSRLLAPADFGLFAMVAPVFALVLLLQDLGLQQAVVQRPEITGEQVNALFWIGTGVSVAVALALAAAAPLVGAFYGDPRAADLALALAPLVVLAGLAAQHLALLQRGMRFGVLAALDAGAYVLGFVAALAVALLVGDHWALYAAPAAVAASTLAFAWAASRWTPSAPPRRAVPGVREMLGFGGGLLGFNGFNFLVRNLDAVLIGRAWGAAPLGLYDRAYRLLLFPLQQVSAPLSRVMVPTLSRLLDQPGRYRSAYLRTFAQVMLVTGPGIVAMAATADALVPFLLGERWAEAAPIFMALGATALQQPPSVTMFWLFVSQGRTGALAAWGAFNAATTALAVVVGLPWGPFGVALAYSLTDLLPRLPVLWWMATRSGPVRQRDLYATAWPFLLADAAALAAVLGLRRGVLGDIGGGGGWTALCLVLCAVFAYAAALATLAALPQGRAVLRESLGAARTLLARGR